MSHRSIVPLLILAACATATQASEYRFVAEDSGTVTRLCIATAENDLDTVRSQIRQLRRSSHVQYKAIVNSVRCNDQVLAGFAGRYGAADTFSWLYPMTSRENREGVPHTSVEEVIAARDAAREAGLVVVHVRGR